MPTLTDRPMKLPEPTYKLLRRIAEAEDRTLRSVIQRALVKYAPKLAAEVKQKEAA